jgi:hypothetical protein
MSIERGFTTYSEGMTRVAENAQLEAGVIDAIGSVDAGTTQTDSLVEQPFGESCLTGSFLTVVAETTKPRPRSSPTMR